MPIALYSLLNKLNPHGKSTSEIGVDKTTLFFQLFVYGEMMYDGRLVVAQRIAYPHCILESHTEFESYAQDNKSVFK